MRNQHVLVGPAVLAMAMASGCATADRGAGAAENGSGGVHAGLVLASPLMTDLAEAIGQPAPATCDAQPWELTRNDANDVSFGGIPDVAGVRDAVRWDRQWLRITNGRSREHSIFRGDSWSR